MDVIKGKIQERIVKLRDLSDYTAKVIEDAKAELLQIFNKTSYFYPFNFYFVNINGGIYVLLWLCHGTI